MTRPEPGVYVLVHSGGSETLARVDLPPNLPNDAVIKVVFITDLDRAREIVTSLGADPSFLDGLSPYVPPPAPEPLRHHPHLLEGQPIPFREDPVYLELAIPG